MNHDEGRRLMAQVVREARDTNTAVALLSQSGHDFTKYPEGQVILDNVTATAIFYHKRMDLELAEFLRLSDAEVLQIQNMKPPEEDDEQRGGNNIREAILKVSGTINARIKVKPDMGEFKFITRSDRE
jgi:hypothetical protein